MDLHALRPVSLHECNCSTSIVRLFFHEHAPRVLDILIQSVKKLPQDLNKLLASKDDIKEWIQDLPQHIKDILTTDKIDQLPKEWVSEADLVRVTFELTGSRASGQELLNCCWY
jgi:DNA-binding transcriptional regulator GbsR (MarR family)